MKIGKQAFYTAKICMHLFLFPRKILKYAENKIYFTLSKTVLVVQEF